VAKLPEFKTLEEEQDFWQTHDSMDYQEDMRDLTDKEVAALNSRAQARRLARMLVTLREHLGEEAADSIEQEIRDLLARRCQDSGLNLDELLTRKIAA